jgi:hypothetical protein
MLMCRRHWGMVPPKLQAEVYATCDAMLNDGPMRPYVLATKRAELAVALKESAPASAMEAMQATIAQLEAACGKA